MELNLQYFGGRGSSGGKGGSAGGGSAKEVKFEVREGLGGNGTFIRVNDGDEFKLTGMSYMDRGSNRANLKKTKDMDEHFTDEFKQTSSSGKEYIVTREATIFKPGVKGPRFKSKIVGVKRTK